MLNKRIINTGSAGAACTTNTTQILDAGKIQSLALYRFEDDVNDTASSTGKFSKGAVFNGSSSYITTNLYLGYNWNSIPWSISFWAKADVAGDDYAFGTGNATGWAISFRSTGSVMLISGNNTAITYTVGQWKHFVYTFDGSSTTKGYGNGTLEDTQTSIPSHFASTNSITIGRYGAASSGYFDGQIDQIRFFNKELSSSEINTLYNETSSTVNTLQILGDTSCVAAYTFEGNANDLSTNYNGTASNVIYDYSGTASNISYATGLFGKAASFNPSNTSHINIDSLDFPTNNFTVSVWVYLNSVSASSGYDMILTTAKQNSGGYFYFTFSHNILYYYETGAGGAVQSSTTVSPNQWYHCVLTKSSIDGVKLYLNNTVVGSNSGFTSNNTANTTSGGVNTIGWYNTGSSTTASFDGLMDQMRIFDKALSSSEINSLYNETATTAALATIDNPATLAYYKMADATDETGSYDGTPTNVDFNVQGKYGFAAKFESSSSYLTVPAWGQSQSTDADYSLSFWLKFDSLPTGGANINLIQDSSGAAPMQLYIYGPSGGGHTISLQRFLGVYYYNSGYNSTAAKYNNFQTGQWYHIAISYVASGKNVSVYVNGTQSGSTYSLDTATGSYSAGSTNVYVTNPAGSMDQFRVFNKAISASEVTKLYNEIQCANTITAPENYFQTKLYTGTGASQNITGLNFAPGFVWIKDRSAGNWHNLQDTIRGATKHVYSNATNAEDTTSDGLTAFNSDGFTLGGGGGFGNNGNNFVSWNWKAASSDTTNNDGSITSTVRASQESGFSIVKWTASSTASDTIGSGLGKKVDFLITKKLNGSRGWHAWHKDLPNNGYLSLNSSDAESTPNGNRATVTNNNTFIAESTSGDSMIAYCFANIDGYQRIGSYIGNGSANGPYIYTGFEPAWILIKNVTTNGKYWYVYDNKRSTTKSLGKELYPNTNDVEYDYDSTGRLVADANGFHVVSTESGINTSGATMIFMAIAANPDTTEPTKANSFKTVLYTGDGNSSKSVTGVGFKPDFTWIKNRSSSGENHNAWDSVRGNGYTIYPNLSDAQNTGNLLTLNLDGFTLNTVNNNINTHNYASWNWKALDHDRNLANINTDGTIPSLVSANPAAGFSIVSLDKTGTNTDTYGHGLSSAPEMIILKRTVSSDDWYVYHKDLGNTVRVSLNSSAAQVTGTGVWGSTTPTSSIFTLQNQSGGHHIAYCWHSVLEYSKISSYVGSGSSKSITTGFQPSFVLIKNSTSQAWWNLSDSVRGASKSLFPNDSYQEVDDTGGQRAKTFNSTGFTLDGNNNDINGSGQTYIYMAIK